MQPILNYFNPKYMGNHDQEDMPGDLKNHLQLPFYLFTTSFSAGTLLMLLSVFTHADDVMRVTLYFTMIAFLINLIFLILFIVYALYYSGYTLLILQKTSILLLNIPVVIVYAFFILKSF